jgi:hypothetical protein
MQAVDFLIENRAEILALLGTAWALVSGVVALTPTKKDDAFIARVMQRISFLAPRNIGGFSMPGKLPKDTSDGIGPMIVVLLCIAPLLGACGGSKLRTHVAIVESMDAAIATDAVAIERRIQHDVVAAVVANCTDPDTFSECRDREAYGVSARLARWHDSHNAAVASRDLYVAALRDSTAEQPSIKRLLDEALSAVGAMVEVARAFGADVGLIDLAGLVGDL